MAGGLALLAAGVLRARHEWRRYATFVLLSVTIGPGLIGNVLLKDHWNHPRPREIVELGGALHYVPTPLPGRESGASFPCGHCTVGFLYGLGWWVWKRRRPGRARASLALGLLAGTALGVGRMAAGAHFLSDVVWSALLASGVSHLLYYHVLRLQRDETAASPSSATGGAGPRGQRAVTLVAAAGAVGVLVALFAAPHGALLTARIPLGPPPSAPTTFELVARTANVEIALVDPPVSEISIDGELHGFGLPGSQLGTRIDRDPSDAATVRYTIVQRGWFTDLDGTALVRLPADRIRRVVVRLDRGNVRVTDRSRDRVVSSGSVVLDLSTSSGRMIAPKASPPVVRPSAPGAGRPEKSQKYWTEIGVSRKPGDFSLVNWS